MFTLKYIILICIFESISGIKIITDDEVNGIVLLPYKSVIMEENSEYLAYNFNLSKLNNAMGDCFNKTGGVSENFNHEIQINMDNLNISMREFNNCADFIQNMYSRIGEEYNKMIKLINNGLIPIETLSGDIKYMNHTNKEQKTLDFNNSTFAIATKPRIITDNDLVQIIFRIPYFSNKSTILYRVYPKPMIYNDTIYRLNADMEYAIKTNETLKFYTERSLKTNSFESLNNQYFVKNGNENIKTCEMQLNDTEFNEEYYTKMTYTNKITQIYRDIYFLITKPTLMKISVGKYSYSTMVDEPSKIINNKYYRVENSFFKFNPYNQLIYKIFEHDPNLYQQQKLEKYRSESKAAVLLFLCCTSIFIGLIAYKMYQQHI